VGVRLTVLVCLMFSLNACAGLGGGPPAKETETSLEARVAGYWEAQQRGDEEAVMAFVDPQGRPSFLASRERWKRAQGASRLTAWSLRRLSVSGDEATVEVETTFQVHHPLLGKDPLEIRSTSRDRWVRRQGLWYVVVEEPSLEKLLEQYRRKP